MMNWLDRAIAVVSPGWALERVNARATLSQVLASSSNSLGYSAGRITVYDKGRVSTGTRAENAVDPSQFGRLRHKAWQLYRENKHGRKIVRSLVAKSVGSTGLVPDPMPMLPDGTVHARARDSIRNVWREWCKSSDSKGRPGQGGQTFAGLQQTALRSVILSGELLYRMRVVNSLEQDRRRLSLPIVVQMVDIERLADDMHGVAVEAGHTLFRGIELDGDNERYAYWIYDVMAGVNIASPTASKAEPFSAAQIYHLYHTEDIDQLRGTSWFAPALNSGRDINDLEYNVLKQTALAACIVAGYRLSRGKTRLGVATDSSDDLTDDNGNKIDRLHPGMLINLGKDGDLKGFSPNMNQAGQEQILTMFLRGQATALPGTKPSTVTGDYRQATFSSEKAADNDAWPEIEVVQQWFAEQFCQPVYEAVIEQAVLAGRIAGVTAEYWNRHRGSLCECLWYGPVARSINPTHDAKAASMRIHGGLSSPQIECASIGVRFEDVVKHVKDYRERCEAADLPEVYANNVLGLDTQDLLETEEIDAEDSGKEAHDEQPVNAGNSED